MIYIDLGKHLEYSAIERIKKPLLNAKGFNVLLVCFEKSQEIPPYPEMYIERMKIELNKCGKKEAGVRNDLNRHNH